MPEASTDWRLLTSQADLLAIRDAVKQGDARPEDFESGLAHLRTTMAKGTTWPHLYQLAAETHARRAAWLVKREDVQVDLDAARQLAGEALSRNPHLATARATLGLVELVEVRRARDDLAREAATRRAREAFDAALHDNPRLALDLEDVLKDLRALRP
jgi:hypothetical protein